MEPLPGEFVYPGRIDFGSRNLAPKLDPWGWGEWGKRRQLTVFDEVLGTGALTQAGTGPLCDVCRE